MISASVERQLEGEARFEWHPQGLQCSLAVPRGDKIEPMLRHAGANRLFAEDKPALPIKLDTGNRILLVEDEILVAMMMRDMLGELGFSVIGPFSRLSEAMVAAVHDEIDGGIIDVNLGGEFVYPVADVLVARNIPFVFVTGYGVESIDADSAPCRSSRSRCNARRCKKSSFPPIARSRPPSATGQSASVASASAPPHSLDNSGLLARAGLRSPGSAAATISGILRALHNIGAWCRYIGHRVRPGPPV